MVRGTPLEERTLPAPFQDVIARGVCWQIGGPHNSWAESQLLKLEPQISARYLSYALRNPLQCSSASQAFLKVAAKDPTVLGLAVAALQSDPPKGESEVFYSYTTSEIADLCTRIVSGNRSLIAYITKGFQQDRNRPVLEDILGHVGRKHPDAISHIAFGLKEQNPKVFKSTVTVLSKLDPEPVLGYLIDRPEEPAYMEGARQVVKLRGAEAIKALLLLSTYFGHQPRVLKVLEGLGPDHIPMAEKATLKLFRRRTIEAASDTLEKWKSFYQQPAAAKAAYAGLMRASP